jgi:hypothetical protein
MTVGKANDRQVGGDHYKGARDVIQHWDYAWKKEFDPFQYQITKYVERWKLKNGIQDLEKARHFLDKYIELAKEDEARAAASTDGSQPVGRGYVDQDQSSETVPGPQLGTSRRS